ncbi:MAG: NAD-dependent epimerase/dehydratase family protein [Gammaproteobacteria bacterium]
MEKVLVTGGAGFIGSHSVDALLAKNIPVRALDNLSSGRRENLPLGHPRLELMTGDIRDAAQVKLAMQGCSHCLHLAAQVSVTQSLAEPRASADTNVLGFVTVLEAARAARMRRFVYASSAAVYGDPHELPLTEDAGLDPLSPYGLEKLINERYADLYRRLYGLSAFGLRYFNVFGPRQDPQSPYAGVIALFAKRLESGQTLTVFGDGQQTRDFVFVGDVARTNVAALENEAAGICNVATGHSVSLLTLIDTLGRLYGAEPEIDFLPPRHGDIQRSAADPSHLHRLLGIRAGTTLEQGLRTLLPDGAFCPPETRRPR